MTIAWSTLDAEPQTSPPPMGGIGYHSRTPLVRIAGTLNSQCYISETLEPVVLPNFQGLAMAIFQQDNPRPHLARIVQSSSPGGTAAYQLLHRSVNRQVANMALSPAFRYVSIESPL
ncbi:transposable element Tcb1 transposase [Trichonephila clavipes]|nr:transposable element Tcb1 transposase [Trichonephila clavipes]